MPERPDLSLPLRVHLVGIGGAGMSAYASVLAAMGHRVSGSDHRPSAALDRLAAAGVTAVVGHDPASVAGADLVAASTAVPAGSPELVEARRLGLPVLSRAELLSAICATRRTVAVAGTKGKTTTTAMLAGILDAAGWRPSVLVGGDLPGGGGARWVDPGEWLVVEADESDGTFLDLGAEAVAVTNLEADHLDHWGSMDALSAAFARFLSAARGPRVLGIDTPASAALAESAEVRTVGTSPAAQWRLSEVEVGREETTFTLTPPGEGGLVIQLPVPGLHNARNAAVAVTTAAGLGIQPAVAAEALAAFRPVSRRFERRGERGGAVLVDDYAHLPSAIAAAVATARAGRWSRVLAVFQPHLYSRTAAMHRELGAALAQADVVVITDVYGAREEPVAGVDGRLVADAAVAAGAPQVVYVPERAELAAAIAALLRPGDLCLTLGAGDVTELAAELLDPA